MRTVRPQLLFEWGVWYWLRNQHCGLESARYIDSFCLSFLKEINNAS